MKPYFILGSKKSGYKPDDIMAVGDHFSWTAMFVAPFWFLWRGMIVHAGLAAVIFFAGLAALTNSLISPYILPGLIIVALWFGCESRFFYFEHLKRQGAVLLDVVIAPNPVLAEELFLDKSLSEAEVDELHIPSDEPMLGDHTANQTTDLFFSQNWRR